MARRNGRNSFDDRHGPRRSRGANNRGKVEKKPSLRERAAELGIFTLRRGFLEPMQLMQKNQEGVADRLGRKGSKAYEVRSSGLTVVGLNNYPDGMFQTPTYRSLTSEYILEILSAEYGLGDDPAEAVPTGRVLLLSKSARSPRQKLALEVECPIVTTERLMIEKIIQDAELGHRLKNFGITQPKEHVTIGHVDVRQLSDREYDNPGLLLNPDYGFGDDGAAYVIPDKMIFDAMRSSKKSI